LKLKNNIQNKKRPGWANL